GRRDGAVQIGAINVFPAQIGDVIAEHPGVVGCDVRLSRRSGALDRLIADITVAPGLEPDEDMAWAIDEWCRSKLRPAERPRIYRFRSEA
ncbi:MAG: 4-coumarate--CoA ligase, partial [Pseudomonadota bacterium]